MTECKPDRAVRRPKILSASPGLLNPEFKDLSNWQESIDFQSETVYSVLTRTIKKVFGARKFKEGQILQGILLQTFNPRDPTCPCVPQNTIKKGTQQDDGTQSKRLAVYRIRIPEIHFALPVPDNLQTMRDEILCKVDQFRIDSHQPLAVAANLEAMEKTVRPGMQVRVRWTNNNIEYLGPSNESEIVDPAAYEGNSPVPQGKCLEDVVNKYSNAGATGDPIGSGKNLSKTNTGRSPMVSGIGMNENKIITGDNYKKWLLTLFQEKLIKEDKYKGIVWLGVCKNNGEEDSVGMLSDDGKRVADGKPGRSTVIYMPTGTDPTAPLEIIYWFHDTGGFKNSHEEWDKLWYSLREMTKKKLTLDGARRNFVFVVPEMLWSQGSSNILGVPRSQTVAATGRTDSIESSGYSDRQWAAWQYNGGNQGYKIIQPLDTKVPTSHQRYKGSSVSVPPTVSSGEAGNMTLLHVEVINLLQKHFGLGDKKNIKYITLVADRKGGIAISNLARMRKLKELNPTKIVLFHADYSSTDKAPKRNFYADSDIFEIIKNIDRDNPPQIEIHLVWDDKSSALPRNAAATFIGTLASKTEASPEVTSFKKGIGSVIADLTSKIKMKTVQDIINPSAEGPSGVADAAANVAAEYAEMMAEKAGISLQEWLDQQSYQDPARKDHERGFSFLKYAAETDKLIRLRAPFQNILCKFWPSVSQAKVLEWTPISNNLTSPMATIKPTKEKQTPYFDTDPGIPMNVREVFKKFHGKAILYRSKLVGPSQTVAILQPNRCSVLSPYELIYYLHGDIGQNGAAKTYQLSLENQFKKMVEDGRNVVIVLVDIDPSPSSASSKLWSDPTNNGAAPTFNEFHEEVLETIKAKWSIWKSNSTPKQVITAAVPPSFFTIKAHGGSSRTLKNILSKLHNISKPGGLRRIDLFNANWTSTIGFIQIAFGSSQSVTLGTDFEVQVIAGPTPIGPPSAVKISAQQLASKLLQNPLEGIYAELVETTHNALPYAYFSRPSLLSAPVPQLPTKPSFIPPAIAGSAPGQGASEIPPTQLVFDKDGKAYDPLGNPVAEFDLKPISLYKKGRLKNHTPSTEEIGRAKISDAACREFLGTTRNATLRLFNTPTERNCSVNPLGLVKYETSQFGNIEFSPINKNYLWGSQALGKYFKGLDDIMWSQTGGSAALSATESPHKRATRPTIWVIKDISPSQANGVDKVMGHDSHREGTDVDIVLPQLDTTGLTPVPVGRPYRRIITPKELDVDKTLAFIILSKLHGAKVIFLDRKFFEPIKQRANFIATDGHSPTGRAKILEVDRALKLFFKDHLFGKPEFVEDIMKLLKHKKGHEDHFHVRILRKESSHEARDFPRAAIRRLEQMGCAYG